MKEKIINSLAIIFLAIACIFNSLSILKIKEQINQNNNKIVETKGVKRAFDNAPTKTNNLPGFNQEFKIYFNISTLNEFIDFFKTFNIEDFENDSELPIILFYGTFYNETEQLNNMIMIGVQVQENKFNFSIATGNQLGLVTFQYYYYENDNITFILIEGQPEQTLTNELLSEQMETLNNALANSMIYSNSTYVPLPEDPSFIFQVSNELNNQDYIYGYDGEQKTIPGALLGTITIIATGILNILISLFNNVLPIFWVNNAPTFVGTIVLFAVAIPITYWVINFVIGLIRKIRLTRGK